MRRELLESENENQMCDCGLPRSEHHDALFGEECQLAKIHRLLDSLIADAPRALHGADITFSADGWHGAMTEPETSEAERLAEAIAAACEELDGPLPLGPENCEGCGRDPDSHIGGPILERALDGVCEIGAWEDRAYALLRDLAAASIVNLSATPSGYEMDSASEVDPDDVTLRLIIE